MISVGTVHCITQYHDAFEINISGNLTVDIWVLALEDGHIRQFDFPLTCCYSSMITRGNPIHVNHHAHPQPLFQSGQPRPKVAAAAEGGSAGSPHLDRSIGLPYWACHSWLWRPRYAVSIITVVSLAHNYLLTAESGYFQTIRDASIFAGR